MTTSNKRTIPSAMTIAGSDSGGGAGIQADLKTFSALGVFGTSCITAITAQNTVGVRGIHEIPEELIADQITCVLEDIGADAVKTGMLSSIGIVETVSTELSKHDVANLVVDPVMIAKSGDALLKSEAVQAVRDLMLPLATVVTPNIPEAEVLTELSINSIEDMKAAAKALVGMGCNAAVVKGGHMMGPASDLLYDGSEYHVFSVERIDTVNTHGTGCTFASAIAAGLAKRLTLYESVSEAKRYITEAIQSEFNIGKGHGPLNHFHRFWE